MLTKNHRGIDNYMQGGYHENMGVSKGTANDVKLQEEG